MRDATTGHAFSHLSSGQPNWTFHILLVLHAVLFLLLDIVVFRRPAVVASERLIVAGVGGISYLEGTKQRLWFLRRNLGIELLAAAVSNHLGVESSVLADYM